MPLPLAATLTSLDALLPNTGTIGFIALIQNVTFTGVCTLDNTTDTWTALVATGFVVGNRIRITNVGGTLPGVASGVAISSSVDYFTVPITSTTFKLSRSLGEAQAGVPIVVDFANNGTGTQTITEQILNSSVANPDPLNVVLSKELPAGGGYSTRQAVTNVGASVVVSNRAEKNITFTLTGDATGYIYRYYQLVIGGTSAIGNLTGTQSYFTPEGSNITVNSGSPKFVFLRAFLSSP